MSGPFDDGLPPQDMSAELATLGAMVLHTTKAREARACGLLPQDFYRDAHGWVCAAVYALLDHGTPVDLATVATELRAAGHLDTIGGIEYLTRLVSATPYTDHVAAYVSTVREAATLRRLQSACWTAAQSCGAPGATLDAVLDVLRAEAATVAASAVGDFTSETSAAYDAWVEGSALCAKVITTGLPTLDRWLAGGIQRPELHLVTASSGIGKSSLALKFASEAIDQAVRVGYLSRELSKGNLFARMVSMRSCDPPVPQYVLKRGLLAIERDDFKREAKRVAEEIRDSDKLHIIDERECDGQLASAMRALTHLRDRDRCELLVVDNFNNIVGPGDNGFERRDRVAHELVEFAARAGVPIIVCCQINKRNGEIMHTATLEQGAGVVMQIKREPGSVEADLAVTKNRDGNGEGTIRLVGVRDTYEWVEAEGETPDRPAPPPPRAYKDADECDDTDPFGEE